MSKKGIYTKIPGVEEDVEMANFNSNSDAVRVEVDPPSDVSKLSEDPKLLTVNTTINNLNSELLNCVADNQLDEVKSLLENGANVNALCLENHMSALHIASTEGHLQILETLIAGGAKLDTVDKEGRSALHLATRFNHSTCVQLLVKTCPKLVDLRVGDESNEEPEIDCLDCLNHDHSDLQRNLPSLAVGSSALHIASQWGHIESIRILKSARANIKLTDASNLTCLNVAGEEMPTHHVDGPEESSNSQKFTEVIKILVEELGCRPSPKVEVYRYTPLHTAVKLQAMEALKILMKYFKPIHCDKTLNNSLHVAVDRKLEEPLKALLLCHGKSVVNERNGSKCAPLHMAIQNEWTTGVNILLRYRADILARTSQGNSVLHIAAKTGNAEILEYLLKCSDTAEIVNDCNAFGEPPLFHAIVGKKVRCATLLLEAKADLSMTDKLNRTVLHVAAENNQSEMLEVFFQKSADVCKKMIDSFCTLNSVLKFTALHLAAENGFAKCAKILLDNGSDARKTMTYYDTDGFNALHIAANKGRIEVVEILLRHDESLLSVRAGDGWLPIHLACQYGLHGCIRVLLLNGSDLSDTCKCRDGKIRTAMRLFMSRVADPVTTLESILDEMIYFPQESFVNVNYKILLSTRNRRTGAKVDNSGKPGRSNQMKIIDALLATGNGQEQHKLLKHILIESFLNLQWEKLCWVYYVLVGIYCIFICAFTFQLHLKYIPTDLVLPSLAYLILIVVILTCLGLLIIYEFICLTHLKRIYIFHFEFWMKMLCYSLSILTCLGDKVIEFWPRELASLAILLVWLQFMLLLSRWPKIGYIVLMFAKVASNLLKVLLIFGCLIIGFALSFMIEFRGQVHFSNLFESVIKTMVMMTSEYEYSDLFENFEGNLVSLIVAKVIFLIFLVLVGIVLVNLLVAMAVTDIKDLGLQGNIKSLLEQAEFSSMFERVLFDNALLKCCPGRFQRYMHNYQQVPPIVQISVIGERDDPVKFPEQLRREILNRARANQDEMYVKKMRDERKEGLEKSKTDESNSRKELSDKFDSLMTTFIKIQRDDAVTFQRIERRLNSVALSRNDLPSSKTIELQQQPITTGSSLSSTLGSKSIWKNLGAKAQESRDFDKTVEKRIESIEKKIESGNKEIERKHLELVTTINSLRAAVSNKKIGDDLCKTEVFRRLADLQEHQIDLKAIMEKMATLISKINELPLTSSSRK